VADMSTKAASIGGLFLNQVCDSDILRKCLSRTPSSALQGKAGVMRTCHRCLLLGRWSQPVDATPLVVYWQGISKPNVLRVR
jgi:hypothetical protein